MIGGQMHLFLASYRFGPEPSTFTRFLPPPARVAVLAAAVDAWPQGARSSALTSDVAPLTELGYDVSELDLRRYDCDPDGVRAALRDFDAVWVRGGNTFVLRAQLARSGADLALTELVRGGKISYAGYSAGACVVGPTLRGLEHADDPAEVALVANHATTAAVRWDGLGWIDTAIVAHAPSTDGFSNLGEFSVEDAASVRETIAALERAAAPYLTLADDEVLIVDGQRQQVFSREQRRR